ncbi:MAG: type II toxin-antitoxin system HicA family toxin [Lachnospiraceae bacterium]|nr:type II toxin-antitoxin system HicA family toxin [Lachnospiraceae bacterium]
MSTAGELKRQIKKKTKCYFLREGSNHEIWVNPDTGEEFQIPRHPAKEVKTGTANNILKSAGLK